MTIFINNQTGKRCIIYDLVYNLYYADAGESRGLYSIELSTGIETRLPKKINLEDHYTPIAKI